MKAFAFGVMTGSVFVAGFVALAAPARAEVDPVAYAYAARNAGAVCKTLDEYPTTVGILGVGEAISDTGLTKFQAGEAIYYSVSEVCPRHMDLILRFAAGAVTA